MAPVRISDNGRLNNNPLQRCIRIDFPLRDMHCRARTSDKSGKPWNNRNRLFGQRRCYSFSLGVPCTYCPRHNRGCSHGRGRFPTFRTNGKCACLCNLCKTSDRCRMFCFDRENQERHLQYCSHTGFGAMFLQPSRKPDPKGGSRSNSNPGWSLSKGRREE